MKLFSTVRHEMTEEGSVVLHFVEAKPLYRRYTRQVPWGPVPEPSPPERDVAVLVVDFERDPNTSEPRAVGGVSLWLEGGVTPTEIGRFGWSRWLGVADAIARAGGDVGHPSWRSEDPTDPNTVTGQITRAAYTELGAPVPARRPGRKGHPVGFYEEIARRYMQLRMEGHRNPTQMIATERHYSRSTVAGWVRKARELGFLPAARRGRAG